MPRGVGDRPEAVVLFADIQNYLKVHKFFWYKKYNKILTPLCGGYCERLKDKTVRIFLKKNILNKLTDLT